LFGFGKEGSEQKKAKSGVWRKKNHKCLMWAIGQEETMDNPRVRKRGANQCQGKGTVNVFQREKNTEQETLGQIQTTQHTQYMNQHGKGGDDKAKRLTQPLTNANNK